MVDSKTFKKCKYDEIVLLIKIVATKTRRYLELKWES